MEQKRDSKYCAYCGPAQVNHLALWVSSTGDVMTLAVPTHKLPFYRFFTRLGDVVASYLGKIAFLFGKALGAITLTDDIETTISDRSRLLWKEAKRRSIPMQQLLLRGKPTDTFIVRHKGKTEFFKSLPLPSFNVAALRMDDKIWFKKSMRTAGLPVPHSRNVSDMKSGAKALEELGTVCVKPRSGSNGRHTFPYVKTVADMQKALAAVKDICAFASVEEQLEGNLCRATCVGGTMIGFLQSYYPTVTGDGTSTIAALVAQLNATRAEGVGEIILDDSHIGSIERRGYTLESVLPEGVALPLTYRAGSSLGGSNREFGRSIHESFIAPIEAAAKMTGLSIVGFDIIIPDPMQPADSQRWGFIEANSLPWIDLHAAPFYGDPIDLSPHVWDLWEKSI